MLRRCLDTKTVMPKLFWTFMATVVFAIVIAGLLVPLTIYLESKVLGAVSFLVLGFLALLSVAFFMAFLSRLVAGVYSGMTPRPMREQIW